MNFSLKKALWHASVTAAMLAILMAGLYGGENFRGFHFWQQAAREITARGESLDWKDFIPKPVPDAQNFFQAPMMHEWFTRSTNLVTAASLSRIMANPDTTVDDLDELSASNYLAWSTTVCTNLDLIRMALQRPAARVEGDYENPQGQPYPNYVSYRTVCQVLAHRVRCHLLLGQTGPALADLTLLHDLNRTLIQTGKPSLVSAMIYSAIASLSANTMAYGLDAHAWHEPELMALQQQLAGLNLPRVAADSLRRERASACHLIDTLPVDEMMRGLHAKSVSDLGWWFMPRGWLDQNKALVVLQEQKFLDCFDATNRRISPAKSKVARFDMDQAFRRTTPGNLLARLVCPNMAQVALTTARNQSTVDQALIVCALERYRLVNGIYPSTLAPLSPRFLEKIPDDLTTGNPVPYRRKDEQHFLLYSAGWDEADDGGITARNRDGSEDREHGDWVWQ